MARRLLVLLLASAVFLVAFICDTGALGRLFWASLVGQVGPYARLAAFGVLLLLTGLIGLRFIGPAQLPPAKPRRKASPRAARSEDQAARPRVADGEPTDPKPAVTRNRRKKPVPVVTQSS